MLTRRELKGVTIKKKKTKKMGRCSHLSNCLQEKKSRKRKLSSRRFVFWFDWYNNCDLYFVPSISVMFRQVVFSFCFVSFFNHYWKNWRSPLFLLYKICISLISASALKIIWFTVLFCFFFLPSLPPFPRFLFVFAIIISSTHYGFACQVLHALHHRGLSISHMEKT